jgi:hypothetical protein
MATLLGGALARALLGIPDRDNLPVESPLHRYPLRRLLLPAMNVAAQVMNARDRLGI